MASGAAYIGYIFIGIIASTLLILNCVAIGIIATTEQNNTNQIAIQLAEAAVGAGIIIYTMLFLYSWKGVHTNPQNKILLSQGIMFGRKKGKRM